MSGHLLSSVQVNVATKLIHPPKYYSHRHHRLSDICTTVVQWGVFIRWNGTVEWNGGMERWNGIVEWNGGIVE